MSTGAQLTKEFQVRQSLEGDRQSTLAAQQVCFLFFPVDQILTLVRKNRLGNIQPTQCIITSHLAATALGFSGSQMCVTEQSDLHLCLLKVKERWFSESIKTISKR